MITATQFKTRYAEFNSLDDNYIDLIINEAVLLMGSVSFWGDYYDFAMYRLVAHLIKTSDSNNEHTSKRIGELEVSKQFEGLKLTDTIYGIEYFRVLKSLSGGAYIC